ncbi:WD40 repeat domain-containing protein, partial [Halobium palmae]
MLYAGTYDGVYRTDGVDVDESDWECVLDGDRVMRVEAFAGVEGLFAATESGLYRSPDGEEWTDLGV